MTLANIPDSLRSAAKLVFTKDNYVSCVYTDVSKKIWATAVTHTKEKYNWAEKPKSNNTNE